MLTHVRYDGGDANARVESDVRTRETTVVRKPAAATTAAESKRARRARRARRVRARDG